MMGGEECQDRNTGDVGQVGQDRQVLLARFAETVRAEREGAGPHEEHGEYGEQDCGQCQRTRGVLGALLAAVRGDHGQGELGNRGGMVEGENQHRDNEANSTDDAPIIVAHFHEGGDIPTRDAVDGQCAEAENQWIDQELRDGQHHALAKGEDDGHDAHEGEG